MKKNKKTNIMVTVFMLIFLFLFLIISGRFIFIQTTGEASNVSLLEWADAKREASIVLNAERGTIYDRNGMVLAYNRPTYRIYAVIDESYSKNQPKQMHVTNLKRTAEVLSNYIDLNPDDIQESLKNGKQEDRFQIEFGKEGRGLSQKTMKAIRAEDLPGIYFLEDAIRYYPNGMFASHIIGFARPNEEGKEIAGVTGMEKEKNKLLSGENGFIRYQRDKYNKKLLNAEEVVKEAKDGESIYLTIDQKIQTLLEDVMSQVDDKYNPKRITAAVMDPKTGAILAMSNRPSYNPNNPNQVENWYNDVISTPVEPGSTMKIFTWAAAINDGVYQGQEYFQSGSYTINQRVQPVNDHNNGHGWGSIPYDEGFRRSSNVAASKLVWEKIGADRFYDYLQIFGFDKPTGIDLPNEVPGKILYDYPSDKLRAAFGQGSTVTPIQQLKAATAFVNEGKMLKPYVIDRLVDSNTNEVIKETEPEVVGEPITKETAVQMLELMEDVVNSEDGTGRNYRLDNYSSIGKTGTAQMPNPNGKGYLVGKENHVFSFLGMAPKDNPKLLMHVSVTQPKLKDTETGSEPVAFIFKNVMENGLHYMNINPDKDQKVEKTETVVFPNVLDKKTKEVKQNLEKKGIKAIVIGNGKHIVDASLDEGAEFLKGQKVFLITDKPKMPKVIGWTQRDIMNVASRLDIKLDTNGTGFAVKQSVKPGKVIKKGMTLKVELQPPKENTKKKKSKKDQS